MKALPRVYIYRRDAMYIVRVLICRDSREQQLVLESVRDAFLGANDGGRLLDLLAENLGLDEPG